MILFLSIFRTIFAQTFFPPKITFLADSLQKILRNNDVNL